MSTMSEASPAQPRGRSSRLGHRNHISAGRALYRWLAAPFAGLVRAIRAEVAARQAVRELSRMSEHGLHDLGLAPGDIERVVRRGRF